MRTPQQIVKRPLLTEKGTRDREKLAAYRRIPSVQEYVMVAQDQRSVEIYRRQGDINWTYQAFTDDEAVTLSSVGLTLAMASIYNPS